MCKGRRRSCESPRRVSGVVNREKRETNRLLASAVPTPARPALRPARRFVSERYERYSHRVVDLPSCQKKELASELRWGLPN